MPHITFGGNRFCTGDRMASNSWSSPIIPTPTKLFLRSSRSSSINSPRKKSSPNAKDNLKIVIQRTASIDKEAYLRKLGLNSTKASDEKSAKLLADLEINLTRSPLRSQICRENFPKNGSLRNAVDVDFSSNLGQLLIRHLSVPNGLNTEVSLNGGNKYERYCDGMYLPSDERMLRLRARAPCNYPISYKNHKGASTHVYCFTRSQRMEHLKTIKTGLNKRGRALKKLCKPVEVRVKRLKITKDMWIPPSKTSKRKPLPAAANQPTASTKILEDFGKLPTPLVSIEKLKTAITEKQRIFQSSIMNYFTTVPQQQSASESYPTAANFVPEAKHKSPSTDSSLTGREIVLDGKIVIDLCSDDESDDVVIIPKGCSSKAKRMLAVPQKKSISFNSLANLNNSAKWTAKDLNGLNQSLSSCVDTSRNTVRVDHPNSLLRDDLTAQKSLQPANVHCTVEVQDIAEKLTVAANGRLYVENTQVTVEGISSTPKTQAPLSSASCNGKVIRTRSVSKNDSNGKSRQDGQVSAEKVDKQLAVRNSRLENGKVDGNGEVEKSKLDFRSLKTLSEFNRCRRNESNLIRKHVSSLPRKNLPNSPRKAKSSSPYPNVVNRSYSPTPKRARISLSSMHRSRDVVNGGAIGVKFKCLICGSSGLFGPNCFEKSIKHHMLLQHRECTGVLIYKKSNSGRLLVEAKKDSSPKLLQFNP